MNTVLYTVKPTIMYTNNDVNPSVFTRGAHFRCPNEDGRLPPHILLLGQRVTTLAVTSPAVPTSAVILSAPY